MHPRWSEALLWLLLLWTVAGLFGLATAARLGDRTRLRRGRRALLLTWAGYLALLLLLARFTPARRLPVGTPRCIGDLCFTVEHAEVLSGFHPRGSEPEALLRVTLRITNTSSSARHDPDLEAVLVDGSGHRFKAIPGLSGIRLDRALPAHGSLRSEPIFHLPSGSTDLALDLVHRSPGLARLRLDDPESFGHRPTVLLLPGPSVPISGSGSGELPPRLP